MTREKTPDNFEIGEQASCAKTITEADIVLFADLSGDHNPIHLDAKVAAKGRFGRRIAHGMLTAGLISAVLGTKLPGPGSIYLSQKIDFLAPVFIGDTITATAEVTAWRSEKRIITLKTDAHNQDGKKVISGQAVMLVDR